MMHTTKTLTATLVAVAMGTLLWANVANEPSTGAAMARAAVAFQESLSPGELAKASFDFDDKERLNWHFIPRERKGLPLRELEGKALRTAHALIRSGLSEAGYGQALEVMSLEEVLFLLERGKGTREERRERRHPGKYYLSLFGKPSPAGRWGFRVEGHHLSLNYTIENGKVASGTPEFFGANPGYIAAGPGREIRVLAAEEDLARQILKGCTPEQQKVAWISKKADREIRGAGAAQAVVTDPVGLKRADMSADQRKLLRELVVEYLKNMPADVATPRGEALIAAGPDNITFAWWGGSERDDPHAYRIQGPTFIIEYNNTQNSANHIHSIWRNTAGDFDVAREK